ncbi:MAG: 2OG-Fe(II) oxygenase, partial [Pontixanthobacter sp.]
MPSTQTIPDRDALKRVGAHVRKHLDAYPSAQKLPPKKAEIYAISQFLTADECQRFVMMIEATARPSEAYDTDYASGFRTSYSGNVDPNDPFVKAISKRIDTALGLKAPLGESIQG